MYSKTAKCKLEKCFMFSDRYCNLGKGLGAGLKVGLFLLILEPVNKHVQSCDPFVKSFSCIIYWISIFIIHNHSNVILLSGHLKDF